MPENVRAYIYRVTLAVMPILTAIGVVKDSDVPLYVALAAALLNVGMAVANTSTTPPPAAEE